MVRSEKFAEKSFQAKDGTHIFLATNLELVQPAEPLDSAEHLLDPPPGINRLGIALVPCCPAVDCKSTSAGGVLGHVRRDDDPPHLTDTSTRVKSFSAPKVFGWATASYRG